MKSIVQQILVKGNMNRLGLFVDLGNIYYCVGKKFGVGSKLDYGLYMEEAKLLSPTITRAIAYGAQISGEASDFISCLQKFGYDTRYRAPKEISKGIFKRVTWVCGISMDIVRMIDKFDHIVLGSSNPEFGPIIDWVKEKGVLVTLFACGIPRDLKDRVDRFIEIPKCLLEELHMEEPKVEAK